MAATTDVDARDVIRAVLERHGQTFADEAGIRLDRATPSPLFRLLCLSLLISARISADAAMSAARALADAGWNTPDAMARAAWADRTRVLNRAGYAHYDESTSRYLGDTADLVNESFGGDLRRLRDRADGDVAVLRRELQEFPGIGGVGADVFVREVQAAWDEFVPFVDARAASVADELGLPVDADDLRRVSRDLDGAGGASGFARLVAGLVRTGLTDDRDLGR